MRDDGLGNDHTWWQRGIIYQVYPRSFMDSDGDGVGDLRGITSRLEHLAWLGVDAVWISPIYPSPMVDFGYDVADYTGIHPLFGTLDDVDALVAEAHRHGLRVLLDWVPNHTSDQHPWFLEARSSRDNPKRDWYIWRDARPDGSPPTNWLSVFGGSAWEWDAVTGQYYYHAYTREQPDLNWRHPELRAAMLATLRFWLDRGVDGFRVDALRQTIKDDQFRDNPPNPAWQPGDDPYDSLLPEFTTDRPEVLEIVREVRDVLDAYPERMMVGELTLPIERLMRYYGPGGRGVHLPSNFHLISTRWGAREIGALVERYEAALPPYGWPNWVLGNHDKPRIASRVGPAQARVAAMLLLTLRGTPTIYQGEEIGMHDVPIPPELVQDPFERNQPGRGYGRDPERTPMQWDASPNAGFTSGTPWLPLADDYRTVNVATQRADPRSVLTLHQLLIALRRAEPALHAGSYRTLAVDDDLLVYERAAEGRRMAVALNLGPRPQRFAISGLTGTVALSTHLDREGERVSGTLELRGNEGIVVALA